MVNCCPPRFYGLWLCELSKGYGGVGMEEESKVVDARNY